MRPNRGAGEEPLYFLLLTAYFCRIYRYSDKYPCFSPPSVPPNGGEAAWFSPLWGELEGGQTPKHYLNVYSKEWLIFLAVSWQGSNLGYIRKKQMPYHGDRAFVFRHVVE